MAVAHDLTQNQYLARCLLRELQAVADWDALDRELQAMAEDAAARDMMRRLIYCLRTARFS